MIGSFLTRVLVMVFGYAYPAYECFKTVEMNKPEIEQLRFWCQYWILVAVLTLSERIGDTFVSWIPMYSEAKLAFFIYLWYPKTKGTTYVYDSFFRPYITKHETEIDRNLLELRTRAGDIAVLYWQKASSYGQTRFFEIFQYIASQSTPRPRRTQMPQSAGFRQPTSEPNGKPAATTAPNRKPAAITVPNRKPTAATRPQTEEPPSPSTSTSSTSSEQQEDAVEEVGPSQVPVEALPGGAAGMNAQKPTAKQPLRESTKSSNTNEAEAMQIKSVSSSSANADGNPPPPQETVIEETIRVTRARLRRNRAASNR